MSTRHTSASGGSSATTAGSASSRLPRTVRAGSALASAEAAAKRVTAPASGGMHAASQASVAGSARSSGSTSIPTRSASTGTDGGSGGSPVRTAQDSCTPAAGSPTTRSPLGCPVGVPVAVEVQAQPGAGAEVHERERAVLGGRDPAEHGQHVDAPADLVHLVPVPSGELPYAVAARVGELRQLGPEAGVRRRLRPARHRVVPRERRVRLLGDEVLQHRGQQQRRQPVGRDLGREAAEHVLAGDRGEGRGGEPPARRRVRWRPRVRDGHRLPGDDLGSGHGEIVDRRAE